MGKELHQKAVSFYFTNFPDDWVAKDCWEVFQVYGSVLDVFLPVKKNKVGQKFGFVRFPSGSDIQKLEEKLNSIWIGSLKLRINVCKFERIKGKGNALVPSKHLQKIVTEEVSNFKEFSVSRPPSVHSEVVSLVEGKMDAYQLKLFPCTAEELWLNRCLVGELHDRIFLPDLQSLVDSKGTGRCKVKFFGRSSVLFDCKTTGYLLDILYESKSWSKPWISNIAPWSEELSASHRIVWVRCYGVPLNLWSSSSFSLIAQKVGRVIDIDPDTTSRNFLEYGRVLLCSSSKDCISTKVEVTFGEKVHDVWLVEEDDGDLSTEQSSTPSPFNKANIFQEDEYINESKMTEEFKLSSTGGEMSEQEKGVGSIGLYEVLTANNTSEDLSVTELCDASMYHGNMSLTAIIDSIFLVAQENSLKGDECLSPPLCYSNNFVVSEGVIDHNTAVIGMNVLKGTTLNELAGESNKLDGVNLKPNVLEGVNGRDTLFQDVKSESEMVSFLTERRESKSTSKFSVVRALQLCRVKEGCFFDPKYRANLRKKLWNKLNDFEYDFSVDKSLVSNVRQPRRYAERFDLASKNFADSECANQIGVLSDQGIWIFGT